MWFYCFKDIALLFELYFNLYCVLYVLYVDCESPWWTQTVPERQEINDFK